jgi:hypothetical protein
MRKIDWIWNLDRQAVASNNVKDKTGGGRSIAKLISEEQVFGVQFG